MISLREAAQQALEALVWEAGSEPALYAPQTAKAIAALRAALAQQDETKSDNYLNGYCTGRTDLLKEQQDQQEPVAWMVYTKDGNGAYITDNPADIKPDQQALALWAWPREWQGLTDVEIAKMPWEDMFVFARAIEAKLKEKNS